VVVDLAGYFLRKALADLVPVTIQALHDASLVRKSTGAVISREVDVSLGLVVDAGILHALWLQDVGVVHKVRTCSVT
jgi:hypothetical protein